MPRLLCASSIVDATLDARRRARERTLAVDEAIRAAGYLLPGDEGFAEALDRVQPMDQSPEWKALMQQADDLANALDMSITFGDSDS